MNMPEPKPEEKPKPPHPEPMPPHLLKLFMDISEKIGRLEGMIEVLMKEKED